MTFRARYRPEYKPGAIDGPKAIRKARSVLLNTCILDQLEAESFGRSCGLKPETAARMIADEKARRAGR